ncbi:MAG: T9SS type A sorting domain-containing protein, partial [Chitinophagaceae bacterium]
PVAGSTYNNWNTGEPNNTSSNENAGTIYSSGANAGKWNDLNATSSLGYMVEYGGLSTDPLLQLTASRVVAINIILPVRDLQFAVKQSGPDVRLDWSTSAESETRNYEILHSTDGTNYKQIGSVTAAGNSSSTSTYTWLHSQPGTGTHYYQLAQFDIDGAVHYSEVRTVRISDGAFRLFPTVTTSTVQVITPGRPAAFSVSISNAAGVRVMNEQLSGQGGTIDLSKLTPGIYFAEVVKQGEREVFRIIKK